MPTRSLAIRFAFSSTSTTLAKPTNRRTSFDASGLAIRPTTGTSGILTPTNLEVYRTQQAVRHRDDAGRICRVPRVPSIVYAADSPRNG